MFSWLSLVDYASTVMLMYVIPAFPFIDLFLLSWIMYCSVNCMIASPNWCIVPSKDCWCSCYGSNLSGLFLFVSVMSNTCNHLTQWEKDFLDVYNGSTSWENDAESYLFGAKQGFQFQYPLSNHHRLLFLFCKTSLNQMWCMFLQVVTTHYTIDILQSKVTELTVCSARIFLKLGQLLYLLKLPLIFMHYLRWISLFSAMIFPRRRLFLTYTGCFHHYK